ncbi:MAG: phage major capsid protein [Sulfurimonas sp.]|jgi:HK97 family phage major capsid protein
MAFFDTRELRENRHKLLLTAREILDKADDEKRSRTAEEDANYKKAMDDAETARKQIEAHEQRNDLEREIALGESTRGRQEEEKRAKDDKAETRKLRPRDTPEYRSAWHRAMTVENAKHLLTLEEHRSLSAGTATEGGYLYAPEQFVSELIQNITDETIVRGIARVFPPIAGTDSLGAPVLTDRMAAGEWTSELGTPSTDSSLAFGKRALRPNPLAKEIVVSKVLLRKTSMAEQIVRSELARVVAEAMEKGYMTGTGDQKPLGVFTASANGITTARDVSTGNAATTPTCDGLKAARYELKEAYYKRATWIFHRDVMELIAKLKDGNGRYMLQDSIIQSEGDTLLGRPLRLSEYAPNTIEASAYVGILGDFDNYWIVDSMDVEVLRLEELYARQNKDCFLTRMASDGAPVRSEAFVRVKLGT